MNFSSIKGADRESHTERVSGESSGEKKKFGIFSKLFFGKKKASDGKEESKSKDIAENEKEDYTAKKNKSENAAVLLQAEKRGS